MRCWGRRTPNHLLHSSSHPSSHFRPHFRPSHRYTSSAQFLADLQQIADNARAYNMPGHGRLGTPQLIQLADSMVALARNELSKAWEDIEAADEALQVRGKAWEECGMV